MRQRWSSTEYDVLFSSNPPTQPTAPTLVEARRIADRLRRSTGGVLSQWDDARSLILGNPSMASRDLRSYVHSKWSLVQRSAGPSRRPTSSDCAPADAARP